ncbi:MAG: AraC family transcriptional regulator [Spirochaetota bacterium]
MGTRMDMKKRADHMEGYHHTPSPDERSLGIWVTIAGHYVSRTHAVISRTMDEYQLLYCVAGSGTVHIGDVSAGISAGDVFFVFPNIPHTYRCGKDGWDVWWVHFFGPYAKTLLSFARISIARPVLAIGDNKAVRIDISRIMQLIRKKGFDNALTAAVRLIDLLVKLKQAPFARDIPDAGILGAVDYRAASVGEIARRFGYSKYHFIRKFKQLTGISPWNYILLSRISRAKELLADHTLSVRDIAFTLNFRDPNYFSRIFHRRTGLSPLEFRRRYHEGSIR